MMDDLDHLPLPPDEPSTPQTIQPIEWTPLPLEFVQPLIPPKPVATPIGQKMASAPAVRASQPPVKKVRVRAVIATVCVGLLGILLSGSAAVYLTYSHLPPPLSQLRAKPVIRVRHSAVPSPVMKTQTLGQNKAHLKSHSRRKTGKKASKTKSLPKKSSSTTTQRKPWFSNSNQKGA